MRFIPPASLNAVCYNGELPEEFCSFQLPYAEALRTTGDFGTVISQQIRGVDFSIWKHDFLINHSVLLYPYVPDGIHTINYMLKGNIPCMLVDFGRVELRENTYNLYFVPPVKQYAWLERGQFSCMHIDLSPFYLQELALEFEPLKAFLESSSNGDANVVRAVNYQMDGNIRLLLQDIIHFKGTGMTRNMFLRSRIYDLLLIFSRHLLQDVQDVFRVDKILLEEVREFLIENYHTQIRIKDLCRRFGISQASLSRHFKSQFQITVHQLLTEERMKASLRFLLDDIPVHKVARAVGYSDIFSFTKAFTIYYGISPKAYIKMRNERK